MFRCRAYNMPQIEQTYEPTNASAQRFKAPKWAELNLIYDQSVLYVLAMASLN